MIRKLGIDEQENRSSLPALHSNQDHPNRAPQGSTTKAFDAPQSAFSARWIESTEQLISLKPSWARLSETAVHPNVCFDHNYLIPAFKHLNDQAARILVVESPSIADPQGPPILCLLMPVVKRNFYQLPIACYEVWNHGHIFDSTPLVRRDCGFETLQFAIEFLASNATGLLSLATVSAEPKFDELLASVIKRGRYSCFDRDNFSRAAFRPLESTDEYTRTHLSKGLRKKVARLERRLGEHGELQIEYSKPQSDYSHLAQQFMRLEAAGWKGKNQTAIASDSSSRKFFEELVARSAELDVISFLKMSLDGEPIAMLCDFYSDRHGWAYKTAFSECYSKYSPGLIAEIKNIALMHQKNVDVVDSCTTPANKTITRICGDRLKFQSVVLGLHQGLPKIATRAMPWIQRTARQLRHWKNRFAGPSRVPPV